MQTTQATYSNVPRPCSRGFAVASIALASSVWSVLIRPLLVAIGLLQHLGGGNGARAEVPFVQGRLVGRAVDQGTGSASEISRSTRRHSCDRIAIRAITRSSNEPVSELLGSSRRAARSSSATSGEAARAFGHQQQQAGRGALALDALDQRGQLVAIERQEVQPGGRPRARS